MADRFQGDPKLILTENGSDLVFNAGQPVMDQGFENAAFISLFTEPGWCGNVLFQDENQKIGSDYEFNGREPVTLTNLNNLRDSAEKALAWMITEKIATRIQANTANPTGQLRVTEILIEPPGQDVETLLLTKYGENWINQATDPAHKKV